MYKFLKHLVFKILVIRLCHDMYPEDQDFVYNFDDRESLSVKNKKCLKLVKNDNLIIYV